MGFFSDIAKTKIYKEMGAVGFMKKAKKDEGWYNEFWVFFFHFFVFGWFGWD